MPQFEFTDGWTKELQRRVWACCQRELPGQREDAEDLFGIVSLSAVSKFSQFRGIHRANGDLDVVHRMFCAWVLTIVHNEAIRLRNRLRRKRETEGELPDEIVAPSELVLPHAMMRQDKGGITSDTLPELFRDALRKEEITTDMVRVIVARMKEPRPTWDQIGLELQLKPGHCAVLHGRAVVAIRLYLFLHRPDLLGGSEVLTEGFEDVRSALNLAEAEAFDRCILNGDRRYRRSGWRKALERACTRVAKHLDISSLLDMFSVIGSDDRGL